MAVIEYDSYKQKLLAMSDTFENLQKALDIESSKHEIARLEAQMKKAAEMLEYEYAAVLRDRIIELRGGK